MSNIDAPDSTMSLRGRNAASTGWFIAYSTVALVVVPFLLVKQEASTLNTALPFLMAGGPALAGLWGMVTTYLPDPKTGEPVPGRKALAIVMLWWTVVMSAVTWVMSSVLVAIGNDNWDSYNVLKSGGLATYALLGLLPVIAYLILMQAAASRRIISSCKWQVASGICLAVSMLVPWFWAGFKVYSDYHAL